MEANAKLSTEETPQEQSFPDTIMLCVTKAGRGIKVVHNGIWYFASRRRVLEVLKGKKDNCLFSTIEDEIVPAD